LRHLEEIERNLDGLRRLGGGGLSHERLLGRDRRHDQHEHQGQRREGEAAHKSPIRSWQCVMSFSAWSAAFVNRYPGFLVLVRPARFERAAPALGGPPGPHSWVVAYRD